MISKLTSEQIAERRNRRDFMASFAEAVGMDVSMAYNVWMGYTRLLSDKERYEMEKGGAEDGMVQGALFASLMEGT